MTAVPLFDAHKGGHCAPPSRLALFFRRVLRMPWRKRAVPAGPGPAGAATSLVGEPARFDCCAHCATGYPCDPPDRHPLPCSGGCNDVLGGRMIADVRAMRARKHADAMHARYATAVDRLRREAGLPTVAQMTAMRAGSPADVFPPLDPPPWAEPKGRGPVHDTRMDLIAPHYTPDVAAPVFQQAPQLAVEPELAKRVIA